VRDLSRKKLMLCVLCSLLFMPISHAVASESTDILPIDVQVDLLLTKLANLLKAGDNQGVIELIPQLRALEIEIPDNLNFLEAKALFETGQALAARDRLLAYLRTTGREGRYYKQARELLLKVEQEAAIQEERRRRELAEQAEKNRESALKAQILRTRESQRYLHAVGFPLEDTGELTKPTREAIAVYQVRQDLEVNGLVTEELLSKLKAAVPESHNCDSLAAYSTGPDNWGISIPDIAAKAAIPSCNDALRDYPDTIRFQIQYARALVAAGRADDAMTAIGNAARLQYPAAETLIGMIHELGLRSEKGKPDYPNAIFWYKLASARGYPEAQQKMGFLYEKGLGFKRADSKAVEWYHKAASQGYAPAQVDLGLMFTAGRGVKRNYATAIEWFTKAANSGYASGQFYMGDMFEKGRGLKRNRTTAVSWYRKAADQGHLEAGTRVKRLVR